MIACHFFRSQVRGVVSLTPRRRALIPALVFLVLGTALMPMVTNGQSGYVRPISYGYPGTGNNGGRDNTVNSNVPLNEINIRAYRHFRRLFPSVTSGEYWFKS